MTPGGPRVLLANAPTRIPLGGGRERFFVKAGSRWPFSIEKRERDACRYVPFPFALAYLAALLEREGIAVEVYDGVALNADRATFLDRCAGYRPDVLLFEATTPTIEHDLALCVELKQRTGATIALAGAHPTCFARELLEAEHAVDWVLRGEYELAALAAVQALAAAAGPPPFASLQRVPGLVFAAPDAAGRRQVLEGPPPEPLRDLDALPMPARQLFPTRQAPTMWPYWDGFCQRRPAVQLQSSRGCPYRCTFCLWNAVIYGHGPYRTFAPGRVVDEMEHAVAACGAREIYFDDDIFTVREDHVLGICAELERRGLRVPWSVMGDAMAVTERAIDAMARAGCIGMKFGVESAAPAVLKRLRKPVKLERVREVVAWCARRGIKTHATFTFGLEGDTPETMAQTLRFACSLPTDSAQFSVATPFPGTEHHARAKASGLIAGAGWEAYDGARSSVLRFEGMSPELVARCCARAPSRWLRARLAEPAWIARQARFLARVLDDQGWAGLGRRVGRGVGLLLNRAR